MTASIAFSWGSATVQRVDAGSLFLSLLISTVGFAYFVYGKKRPSFPFMVSGAVMMFFSYFVDSFWLSLAIWVVLAAAPFFIR
ncbi:MAG TPA: amino acid transport protein [Planctomycetota bacterium]|jgi:hypothetical protein